MNRLLAPVLALGLLLAGPAMATDTDGPAASPELAGATTRAPAAMASDHEPDADAQETGAEDAPADEAVSTAPADEVELRALVEALRDEVRALRDEVRARPDPAVAPAPPLDGAPSGPMTAYGDRLVVPPGTVAQAATAFGADVEVQGTVTGDVRAFGGDVVLSPGGRVLGDARAFGGDIRVAAGSVLHGVPEPLGGRVVVEPGGAVDAPLPAPRADLDQAPSWLAEAARDFYQWLVFLLTFAGAGILVVALFPDRVHRVAGRLETHPVRAAVAGVGFSLLIGLLSVLFFWTLVGPLLGAAVLGVAWMLGFVGLCQLVGDRLPFGLQPHGRWVAFLVGSVVVSVVGALPWVGVLAVLVASILGMGAAFQTRFGSR